MKNVLDTFKVDTTDDLFLKIGKGELASFKIILSLFPERKIIQSNDKIVVLNDFKQKRTSSILLKGLTPVMSLHYASCCNPIPGDTVLAYISQRKGLIIHIDSCEELKKIKINKSKIINVRWKDLKTNKDEFVAKINVVIKNEIGSLGSLSSIIGKSMSNIRNLNISERNSDFYKIDIEIDVKDLDHLSNVLVSLRTSEFVENVSRI